MTVDELREALKDVPGHYLVTTEINGWVVHSVDVYSEVEEVSIG